MEHERQEADRERDDAAQKRQQAAGRAGLPVEDVVVLDGLRHLRPVAAGARERHEAAERLAAMNDPAKGGSEYLRAKIHNARDALLMEEAPPKPPSDDARAPCPWLWLGAGVAKVTPAAARRLRGTNVPLAGPPCYIVVAT